MAVALRNKVSVASGRAAAPAKRMVVVQASAAGVRVGLAAAAVAAATLLAVPAPVEAGVVMVQPELRKMFQTDDTPAAPKERAFRTPGSAPAPAAEKTVEKTVEKKKDSEPLGEFGIDPRNVALPGAIAAIAGLGFAASKIDEGFSEWITQSGALVRKSDNWAGFEEDIKDDNYLGGAKVATKAGTKVATKKVVKKKGTQTTPEKRFGLF